MNPAESGEAPARTDAPPKAHTENGHQDPQDALAAVPAPSPIIERLRAAYAEHDAAERRKTFMIVPGRYNNALAFRARPIPYEEFRKEAEKAMRRGMASSEAEANYAGKVIATACETILVADGEGGDLRPAEEVVREFHGTGPVRFDSRLCQILGIDSAPESEHAICRLVFDNKQALQVTVMQLMAFFTEETASDDEDEDERPT